MSPTMNSSRSFGPRTRLSSGCCSTVPSAFTCDVIAVPCHPRVEPLWCIRAAAHKNRPRRAVRDSRAVGAGSLLVDYRHQQDLERLEAQQEHDEREGDLAK